MVASKANSMTEYEKDSLSTAIRKIVDEVSKGTGVSKFYVAWEVLHAAQNLRAEYNTKK